MNEPGRRHRGGGKRRGHSAREAGPAQRRRITGGRPSGAPPSHRPRPAPLPRGLHGRWRSQRRRALSAAGAAVGLRFQKVRWQLGGARARAPHAPARSRRAARGGHHAGWRPSRGASPGWRACVASAAAVAGSLRGVPVRPRGDSLPAGAGHPMRSPGEARPGRARCPRAARRPLRPALTSPGPTARGVGSADAQGCRPFTPMAADGEPRRPLTPVGLRPPQPTLTR